MTAELKERLIKEPITIGLMGPIGSGKSTLAERLGRRLRVSVVEERFTKNPYLEDFYGDPWAWSFKSQTWFFLEKVEQLKGLDYTKSWLFDPWLEMDMLYPKVLEKIGLMGSPEFRLYNESSNEIYTSLLKQRRIKKPDLYICTNARLPVLEARIRERGRPYELLMLKNYPHYLANLSAEVDAFRADNFLQIDTTKNNSLDEMHIDGLMEKVKRRIL